MGIIRVVSPGLRLMRRRRDPREHLCFPVVIASVVAQLDLIRSTRTNTAQDFR